jgi:hypothetical protein
MKEQTTVAVDELAPICDNPALGIQFLRGKSVAGAGDPSSGRSPDKPKVSVNVVDLSDGSFPELKSESVLPGNDKEAVAGLQAWRNCKLTSEELGTLSECHGMVSALKISNTYAMGMPVIGDEEIEIVADLEIEDGQSEEEDDDETGMPEINDSDDEEDVPEVDEIFLSPHQRNRRAIRLQREAERKAKEDRCRVDDTDDESAEVSKSDGGDTSSAVKVVRICGVSIAEKKRMKKERRRELAHAISEKERVRIACLGYEAFNGLDKGTCTIELVKRSSAGISGWSEFGELVASGEVPLGSTPVKAGSKSVTAVETTTYNKPANTVIPTLPSSRSDGSSPTATGPGQECVGSYSAVSVGRAQSRFVSSAAIEGMGHVDLLTKMLIPHLSPVSFAPQSGWEYLEITVDSGACDTVLPSGMLSSIALEQSEGSKRGDEYEVANGHSIVNEGQKRCVMMTPGSSSPKGIIFQVSDVHKPLMSVGSMADAGYECLLRKDGGIMRDTDTGECIPIIRRGNLYVLRAWVKSADADFTGQS